MGLICPYNIRDLYVPLILFFNILIFINFVPIFSPIFSWSESYLWSLMAERLKGAYISDRRNSVIRVPRMRYKRDVGIFPLLFII